MLNSEAGAYRCIGCGRVIGSFENGHVVVRHKGRIIRVKPVYGACEIQIICEKPSCHATNTIIVAENSNKCMETLDKTAQNNA